MAACCAGGVAHFLAALLVVKLIRGAALSTNDYDDATGRALRENQLANVAVIAPVDFQLPEWRTDVHTIGQHDRLAAKIEYFHSTLGGCKPPLHDSRSIILFAKNLWWQKRLEDNQFSIVGLGLERPERPERLEN
jgi:hypothetical protein